MSGMDDLVAWLRGRLDERERQLAERERKARALLTDAQQVSLILKDPKHLGKFIPGWSLWPDVEQACLDQLAEVERGRRDIAGKRALLEECESTINGWRHGETKDLGRDILMILAQEFEGEPGWREEWRA